MSVNEGSKNVQVVGETRLVYIFMVYKDIYGDESGIE